MKKLNLRYGKLVSLSSANEDIPVSEMVERANKTLTGGETIRSLDPSNAKSKLKQAAREIQKEHQNDAPPTKINDAAIDEWIKKYGKKRK